MAKKPHSHCPAKMTHWKHGHEPIDQEPWLLALGRIIQAYIAQHPYEFRFKKLTVRGKQTFRVSLVGKRTAGGKK